MTKRYAVLVKRAKFDFYIGHVNSLPPLRFFDFGLHSSFFAFSDFCLKLSTIYAIADHTNHCFLFVLINATNNCFLFRWCQLASIAKKVFSLILSLTACS